MPKAASFRPVLQTLVCRIKIQNRHQECIQTALSNSSFLVDITGGEPLVVAHFVEANQFGGISMQRDWFVRTLLGAAVLALAAIPANAQRFSGKFSGFNELGALNNETGAIHSAGQGTIQLEFDKDLNVINYELTYSGLGSNVTQSHIHFGRVHTPGGIMVFLCTNLGNGPAGTPACPASGGTVTGTITPASVLAVPGQNISAGDFDAFASILAADAGYANIHTVKFPAGEIRAEVRRDRGVEKE
jgi:hypothetical protein